MRKYDLSMLPVDLPGMFFGPVQVPSAMINVHAPESVPAVPSRVPRDSGSQTGAPVPRFKRRGAEVPHHARPVGRGLVGLLLFLFFLFFFLFLFCFFKL
jgi:hypothetical protein